MARLWLAGLVLFTTAGLASCAIDQIVNSVMPLTVNTWVQNESCLPGSWKVRTNTLLVAPSAMEQETLSPLLRYVDLTVWDPRRCWLSSQDYSLNVTEHMSHDNILFEVVDVNQATEGYRLDALSLHLFENAISPNRQSGRKTTAVGTNNHQQCHCKPCCELRRAFASPPTPQPS